MGILLLLLDSLKLTLIGSQSATHGTGLLDTQIQGDVLLLLIEKTQLFTLGLVDDSQGTSNVLANFTTTSLLLAYKDPIHKWLILHLVKLGSRATSNLLNAERSKLLLLLFKGLEKLSLVLVAKFVCLKRSL